MKTRDDIIQVALKLFNKRGTRRVTTNHIAAAAGISPGNLYYHFRDKEAIIRAIFKEMDRVSHEMFAKITSNALNPVERMEATFRCVQEFNRRYIFFKRELPVLVMNDRQLKKLYMVSHRAALGLAKASVDQAVECGYLRSMDGEERKSFAELSWLLALLWINYLEVSGVPVNRRTMEKGAALSRFLMTAFQRDPAR